MSLKKKKPERSTKVDPRSLLESLTASVEKNGVTFFQPDKNLNIDESHLSLPFDITECDGAELGRYLNAFTQHRMYLRTTYGWQSVIVEEARRKYIQKSSAHYSRLSANTKLSETAKDKLINLEEDVYPLYEEYSNEREKLGLLDVALASVEDGIFLISREISRRTHDWDTESRNENVGKIKSKKMGI